MDSFFLGSMISMSSTTIIIKAFDDLNIKKQRFTDLVFGVLVVEDLVGILLLVLFAGIKICSICYDFGYRVFTEPAMTNGDGQDVLVQVEKGISAEELGQLLEDKGLVRDHNLFYLQLKLSAYSGHIKPGIYTLNTSMTAKDMMVIMSSDKSDEEQTQTTEPSDTQ